MTTVRLRALFPLPLLLFAMLTMAPGVSAMSAGTEDFEDCDDPPSADWYTFVPPGEAYTSCGAFTDGGGAGFVLHEGATGSWTFSILLTYQQIGDGCAVGDAMGDGEEIVSFFKTAVQNLFVVDYLNRCSDPVQGELQFGASGSGSADLSECALGTGDAPSSAMVINIAWDTDENTITLTSDGSPEAVPSWPCVVGIGDSTQQTNLDGFDRFFFGHGGDTEDWQPLFDNIVLNGGAAPDDMVVPAYLWDMRSAPMARQASGIAANYDYNATVYTRERGNNLASSGKLYRWDTNLTPIDSRSPCQDAGGGRYAANYLEPVTNVNGVLMWSCVYSGTATGGVSRADLTSILWLNSTDLSVGTITNVLPADTRTGEGMRFNYLTGNEPGAQFGFAASCMSADGFTCQSGEEAVYYKAASGGDTLGILPESGDTLAVDVLDHYTDPFSRLYYATAHRYGDGSTDIQLGLVPGEGGSGCSVDDSSAVSVINSVVDARLHEDAAYTIAQNDTLSFLGHYHVCTTGDNRAGVDETVAATDISALQGDFLGILGEPLGGGNTGLRLEESPDGRYLVLQSLDPTLGATYTLFKSDTLEPLAQYLTGLDALPAANTPIAMDSGNRYIYVLGADDRVYRFNSDPQTTSSSDPDADPSEPNPPADPDEVPPIIDDGGGGSSSSTSGSGSGVSGDNVLSEASDFCSERWGFDCGALFGLLIVSFISFIFAGVAGGIGLVAGFAIGFIVCFMLGLFPLWALLIAIFLAAVLGAIMLERQSE